MAGNTKLVGFSPREPGKPGIINLARWNGKTAVTISEESLESLRSACYNDLPQQPEQGRRDDLDEFNVHYDESVGRVCVDMDIPTAQTLAKCLGEVAKIFKTNEAGEWTESWVHHLKEAIQAHKDYHDRQEPGVDESPR